MTAALPAGAAPPPPPPSSRRPQQRQGAAPSTSPPCCSFQTSLGPPEYRKWRRLHGLQLPLHPQQVAGWAALALFMAATFLVLVPALGPDLRAYILPVLATLFAVHLVSHLTALLVDPADVSLRRLAVRTAVPEFDRSKHAHVIENGRCHLCNIKTAGPRTKHCSVCNKCVGRFDHHCKWLNHCVGGRNYVAFMVCVVSAELTALAVVVVAIAELAMYHLQSPPQWLSPWTHVPYNRTVASVASDARFPYQDRVFLITVSWLACMAAMCAALLMHLCLFHVYISTLGITTYEYIRRYRQRQLATGGPGPGPQPPTAPKGEVSMLTGRNGGLSHPPGGGRPLSLPRSPNSAEVHSNVGTPLDSSQSSARMGSRSSSRLIDTPPPPPNPPQGQPPPPRAGRTVTFMDSCCARNVVPPHPPPPAAQARPVTRNQSVSSILKKSKSLNDADLEAARGGGGEAETAVLQPYVIPWERDQVAHESERGQGPVGQADGSMCCASLRSSSSSNRSNRSTSTSSGRSRSASNSGGSSSSSSKMNGKGRPPAHARPGTPRSVSDQSLRMGGYQQAEVAEYTGCECNPSMIPVGPPPRYPNGHRPPSRPASNKRRRPSNAAAANGAAAAASGSGSLISRFCASFTAPNPRAGVSHPSGVRRNQVRPSAEAPQARLMGQQQQRPVTVLKEGTKLRRSSSGDSKKYTALPALPQPSRRRLQGVSLKELGDVLAYVQNPNPPQQQRKQQAKQQQKQVQQQQPQQQPQQQHRKQLQPQPQLIPLAPPRRHPTDPVRRAALTRSGRRRSSTPQPCRTRSPTLSPIHESGLSNPSTPQRPRTKHTPTPDSESPPRDLIESDPEMDDDDECADSIMYIDEDDGTFFTASMSSMSSMTPMTPLTPMTPMTPLTPMSAGFPAGNWASKDNRAPASAL